LEAQRAFKQAIGLFRDMGFGLELDQTLSLM
jgi:hypothetical protein